MKNIAIITARGGSKRIPKKNIRNFCGEPIIRYSILAALEAKCFDEVMVSTDSDEIAQVAKKYGASIPFMRSKENSNDFANTSDVINEVLNKYEREFNKAYDNVCCIYPTAPFVTSDKLKKAIEILNTYNVDSVVPVVKFSFPPQRAFVEKDGYIKFCEPDNATVRSQDLRPMYHDAGQFYCFKTEAFKKQNKLIMDKCKAIILDEMEVQDIDNETDWKIAEIKYKMLLKE